MKRSTVRSVLLCATTIAVALVLAPSLAIAAPNDVVDCGGLNSICQECCCPPGSTPAQCAGNVLCEISPFVCCKNPPCTVINAPQLGLAGPPPLTKINLVIGTLKVQFKARPVNGGFVDIQLKQTLNSPLPTIKIGLKARIGGADATVGGLLFPVAFLEAGSSAAAAGALSGLGYDIAVNQLSSETTCQSTMPTTACRVLAKQLGANILSLLQLGVPALEDAYRSGLENMFVAPCGTP